MERNRGAGRPLKLLVAVSVALAAAGAGVAHGSHLFPPQLPAGSAPNGFLVSNSRIDGVPVAALARATAADGARVFVQHVTFTAGQSTGWHTHPGPALVSVVAGALVYEEATGAACRQLTYPAGTGFVDEGFGHVHRAVGGAAGAEFYVTYVLPPDAHAVREPPTGTLPAPPACS